MRSKNLNLRVPRLGVNRYGVFYVRSSDVDESGRRRVTQRSLGTKNPLKAKLEALHFCLGLVKEELMSDINKYESPGKYSKNNFKLAFKADRFVVAISFKQF